MSKYPLKRKIWLFTRVLGVVQELEYRAREEQMSVFHDEVEIEDFEFDPDTDTYYYPCPCGDQFEITRVWKNGGRMEGLGN